MRWIKLATHQLFRIFHLTCIWPRSTMTASIASLSTWGFSWGKGLLSARPCQLLRCITCTECKDAAYCYWCSMVSVHVCLLMTTMSRAKTIEILFGVWTWVGPRNHILVWGARITQGEGAILGCPLLCGFRQNSLTTWLINFSLSAQHLRPSGFLSCWPTTLSMSSTDCSRRLLKTYLFARY